MDNNQGISVNYKWCKACGICIALCPKSVYEKDEFGKPKVVNGDKCVKCLICEHHCPDFAIKIGGKGK